MADWAQTVGAKFQTAGSDTVNSRGTAVTSSGSTNTKGSYAQLLASSSFAADQIIVGIQRATSGGDTDFLIDLAVGGAGSEQVVISNLYFCGDNNNSVALLLFPISIPAGTRVAARCQCSVASTSVYVSALLCRGGFAAPSGLGRVTTYGANTADSGGVSVDPGGVAHTKGSWSQITASTTNPIRHLLLRLGNQANLSRTNALYLIDLAVGGAGSEQVVISNLPVSGSGGEVVYPDTIVLPLQVPAGTRLAARAQCSIIDATDRLFDVIAYGVD